MNLLDQLQAMNRPMRQITRTEEIARANWSQKQRDWHQEWARKNREISRAIKARIAAENDAKVMAKLHALPPGPHRHAELASALHISQDWLRKTVLPRLERKGLVRKVLIAHPVTGWNLRCDWEVTP